MLQFHISSINNTSPASVESSKENHHLSSHVTQFLHVQPPLHIFYSRAYFLQTDSSLLGHDFVAESPLILLTSVTVDVLSKPAVHPATALVSREAELSNTSGTGTSFHLVAQMIRCGTAIQDMKY